jgi:hypothetical protein
MTGQDHLRAGLPRVVEVLHGLARGLELTNDELLATLAFLSDVGRIDAGPLRLPRRSIPVPDGRSVLAGDDES